MADATAEAPAVAVPEAVGVSSAVADEQAQQEPQELGTKGQDGGEGDSGSGKQGAEEPEPEPESAAAVAAAAAAAAVAGGGGGGGGGGTAIIVPYRDLHPEQERGRHLQRFLEEMPRLLQAHAPRQPPPPFHIYIVEQSDDGRKFNRGKLLNIGFQLAAATHHHDTYIFHDVDLLPSPELVPSYLETPAGGPVHIARVWGRYSGNPKYIGGAVAFTGADFKRINGFPNTFWGWGGEDDEMRRRIDEEKLRVSTPSAGSMEDMEQQTLEAKLQTLRAHRDWKCNVKWEALNEHAATWRQNGLANLDYELLATEPLGAHATKHRVDVKLNGHWTDTVHEAPPSSNNSNTHHGQRGGGVRGRGVGGRGGGGWRGGRGGGGGRGYEPDAKRRRYG